MKEFNDKLYYSDNDLMSHNAMINFCFGGRGLGKSFAFKRRAINNFLKRGEQTIYVRRTEVELNLVKKTYFNDIKEFYSDDIVFKVDGNEGYINGELAIIFVALSTSSNFKSSSYPLATLIIFDEYLIPQGGAKRYLKNEAFLLLELFETIFRLREGRIILLANSISYVNPLFTYFDIEIKDSSKRFHKYKDNLICVELCKNELYEQTKNNTKFGKLIQGTEYGDYAIQNNAYEDDYSFISSKRPSGRYFFLASIVMQGKELGFWLNMDNSDLQVYCDYNFYHDNYNRYVCFNEDLKTGYTHIKEFRKDYKCYYIKSSYLNGQMVFKNQEAKKLMLEIIKFI